MSKKMICSIYLLFLVVFMNACGHPNMEKPKPDMTVQQVKDDMGKTGIGYAEKFSGDFCQNSPGGTDVLCPPIVTWDTLHSEKERQKKVQLEKRKNSPSVNIDKSLLLAQEKK